MAEKAKVSIYKRVEEEAREPKPAPTFRGPGFKQARESTKTAIGTKLDNDILARAREFCHKNGITFASFLEVAIVDELEKRGK